MQKEKWIEAKKIWGTLIYDERNNLEFIYDTCDDTDKVHLSIIFLPLKNFSIENADGIESLRVDMGSNEKIFNEEDSEDEFRYFLSHVRWFVRNYFPLQFNF